MVRVTVDGILELREYGIKVLLGGDTHSTGTF